ncbi:unnamed protein product [Cylicostephanus goldi]|uniref:Uncharacterized protein n=1 Tax=Cylicostephanus goldi TaxID=71465 RepID=A0A3P7N6X0_CYLGO|nr:unnamed protein product [Cylicostephanus goldi]
MNVGLLALSGVVWFMAIKKIIVRRHDIRKMLKNLVSRPRRQARPRVEIIHVSFTGECVKLPYATVSQPMDSFSTPPSTQSDAMSTIRLKLSKFSSRGRKTGRCLVESFRSSSPPSSAPSEHLSVSELHQMHCSRNSR